MSELPKVQVGVGVFILDPARSTAENPAFLLGKRKGSHGAGSYALPGGHLEFGESFEDCARREVAEETGLQVVNVHYLTATNDPMLDEKKHYVTIFMACERANGTDIPLNLEANKCEGWDWVSWQQLKDWVNDDGAVDDSGARRNVFTPLISLVHQRPESVPALPTGRKNLAGATCSLA